MKRFVAYIVILLLIIPLACVLLWYLGPRAEVTYACPECGKLKETKEILGIVHHSEIISEELGDWYDAQGLRRHKHDWRPVSSYRQAWGGRGKRADHDGSFLFPLVELKRVKPLVDDKQFKELTELYYQVHDNGEKHNLFMKKCAEIKE